MPKGPFAWDAVRFVAAPCGAAWHYAAPHGTASGVNEPLENIRTCMSDQYKLICMRSFLIFSCSLYTYFCRLFTARPTLVNDVLIYVKLATSWH